MRNSQKRLNSLGSILEMIGEINKKLFNDEVLSGDPVVQFSLAPNFSNLFDIVHNEIKSELKRIEALKRKNRLMDKKDAGPGLKK